MVLRRSGRQAGPLGPPAYFLAINVALGLGILRGILGLQTAAWRRTHREAARREEHA
jgi:hypothetical protein